MTPPKQRYPKDDEQNDFIHDVGENEDIIYEEQNKFEQRVNDYHELQNELMYEEREVDKNG